MDEHPQGYTTPVRKTARMSTGRKPPPIPAKISTKFISSEAEEGGDSTASDDGNLDSGSDRGEEVIPWERTPTPESRGVASKEAPEASTPAPTRVTRSKARAGPQGTPGTKRWDPKTHQLLVTSGHSHSNSDKRNGVTSPSMRLGTETSDTQRKLRTVVVTGIKSTGAKETAQITLSGEDAEAFEAFKRTYTPKDKGGDAAMTFEMRPKEQSASPSARLPSPEIEELSPSNVGKPDAKGKKPEKRKRVDSVEIVAPPATSPAEAFAALQKAAVKTPSKKVAKISDQVEEKYLEEQDVKDVKSLPPQCQVTNRELQDKVTYHEYLKLPKLLAGVLIAWSTREGPGMYMISDFAEDTPNVDFPTLWSCFLFVSKDEFVNLARANPLDFTATSQIYTNEMKRWVLEYNDRTAVCVSIVSVVSSAIMKAKYVVEPQKKSLKAPLLKFVTGIHLSQDYDRIVGLLGMVFHHSEMHAQLNEDAITFGTKSITLEKLQKTRDTRANKGNGTRSSATKYRTTSYTASTDSLAWDDEVPVYDARHTPFNASRDIDNLDRLLPRYDDNKGEIPNGSCALVAYTVSQYLKKPADEEHISFNIRFAVVLADPGN
ncbi:hypothetical protein R3P38DRAFT_2764029 [Favolaschia claudopus]|uniref:Uncharacterized protein n=1 Tax=Favolaschia claudopus TaxID=2862362 RepID=A0AAW0DIA8_9AGAR